MRVMFPYYMYTIFGYGPHKESHNTIFYFL